MRLEAAGRQARAEVQGPQTQLYRASRALCTGKKQSDHVSQSHFHIEVIMQVCDLQGNHKERAFTDTDGSLPFKYMQGTAHEITVRSRSMLPKDNKVRETKQTQS